MPAKPLNPEQLADAARLRDVFHRWQQSEKAAGRKATQVTVGEEMGLKQPNLNNYLHGRQPLNEAVVSKFAKLFGCHPEDISPTIAMEAIQKAMQWAADQSKGNSPLYRDIFGAPPSGTPQSTGEATGVTHTTPPPATGQIWRLPVVQGDQLKILKEPNSDARAAALPKESIEGAFDIDITQDKIVELLIETPRSPRMKIGDKLVMRPMPDHQVSIKYLPVVVRTAADEYFMMEYERDLIEQAGLDVVAYTVAWMQRPDQTLTVITPKKQVRK